MCWFGVWMAAAIAFGAGFIVCGIFCGKQNMVNGTKPDNETDEQQVQHHLAQRELTPIGVCHWCNEYVKGDRLFCCKECADDWERNRGYSK